MMVFEFSWMHGLVFGIEYATPYALEGTEIKWAINIYCGLINLTILKF